MTVLDFGDSRAYTKLRTSDRIWRTRSLNVNSEKVPDQQLECNQEGQCGQFNSGCDAGYRRRQERKDGEDGQDGENGKDGEDGQNGKAREVGKVRQDLVRTQVFKNDGARLGEGASSLFDEFLRVPFGFPPPSPYLPPHKIGHFLRGKTSNTPSTSVDAGDPCHARPQRPVIVRNQQGNRIEVRWTYALILACITQTFRQVVSERSDRGHSATAPSLDSLPLTTR